MASATSSPGSAPAAKRSLTPMLMVFLCTLAPIVAATVLYMNPQWWPKETSNYGALVEPQRPMPDVTALTLTTLDGQPFDLQALKGKWLLVSADEGACPDSCALKLFIARNSHASQGKNVERLARVWFITDDAPVPEAVRQAYQGTVMLRARPEQLAAFLLGQQTAQADNAALLKQPIWVIDPLGNLMLQYPQPADENDGVKVRKDISKLIYSSRIG